MVDCCAFCQYQPDRIFCSALVVLDNVVTRDTVWRKIAGHRRHDDSVIKKELRVIERSEKSLGRHFRDPAYFWLTFNVSVF